jgi:hypothetical protein
MANAAELSHPGAPRVDHLGSDGYVRIESVRKTTSR